MFAVAPGAEGQVAGESRVKSIFQEEKNLL
jgi:hypothetical protein